MAAALLLVPSAAHIIPRRGLLMAPTKQQNLDSEFQRQIFDRMKEIKDGMDESLKLGRANGEAIRTLRAELGVDGVHGRLPQLEQAMARLDRQQEMDHKELIVRIDLLEKSEERSKGKVELKSVAISILTSSASAAAIGWLAKMLGFIH